MSEENNLSLSEYATEMDAKNFYESELIQKQYNKALKDFQEKYPGVPYVVDIKTDQGTCDFYNNQFKIVITISEDLRYSRAQKSR